MDPQQAIQDSEEVGVLAVTAIRLLVVYLEEETMPLEEGTMPLVES